MATQREADDKEATVYDSFMSSFASYKGEK